MKKDDKTKTWGHFIKLFLNAENEETIAALFELFTTRNEREMLVDRYCLVKALLTTDLSQREMSEKLKVSISKITAGSKATQVLPEEYRQYLKKKMK